MSTPEVWIVEDDRSLRWVMEQALADADVANRSFPDAESFRAALEHHSVPGLVVMDVRLPGSDGLTELAWLQGRSPDLPVLLITAQTDLDMAISAYERGAFEYLPKPFDLDEFMDLVRRGLDRAAVEPSQKSPPEPAPGPQLVGESPAMQAVFRTIGRLSRSELSVLITGESGTGKELVARALHDSSPRAGGPFVAVNSAAIPEELLESELFGHERGAFTGAVSRRAGRFEQAHGGTLFLDEIGDMPVALQTRLLRVLSERSYYRVGGHEPVEADVRVLAATHQDLARRVQEGKFREDLYHRLNVVRIRIPPLRERAGDLPRLADHLLGRAADETGLARRHFTNAAITALQERVWPGNVRELMNVCRRVTVMAPSERVDVAELPEPEFEAAEEGDWQNALRRWAEERATAGENGVAAAASEALENTLIDWALKRTGGRRQEAARLLGWGRNTLTRKLRDRP